MDTIKHNKEGKNPVYEPRPDLQQSASQAARRDDGKQSYPTNAAQSKAGRPDQQMFHASPGKSQKKGDDRLEDLQRLKESYRKENQSTKVKPPIDHQTQKSQSSKAQQPRKDKETKQQEPKYQVSPISQKQ